MEKRGLSQLNLHSALANLIQMKHCFRLLHPQLTLAKFSLKKMRLI